MDKSKEEKSEKEDEAVKQIREHAEVVRSSHPGVEFHVKRNRVDLVEVAVTVFEVAVRCIAFADAESVKDVRIAGVSTTYATPEDMRLAMSAAGMLVDIIARHNCIERGWHGYDQVVVETAMRLFERTCDPSGEVGDIDRCADDAVKCGHALAKSLADHGLLREKTLSAGRVGRKAW